MSPLTGKAQPAKATSELLSLEDKRAVAERLIAKERISRAVLIDDLDGTVHLAYVRPGTRRTSSTPTGRSCYDRHGSTQREVEAVLDELAGRSVTPRKTVDMAPPSSRPVGEGLLRVGKGALYTSHRTAPLPWGNVFPDPRRKPSARPAPNWPPIESPAHGPGSSTAYSGECQAYLRCQQGWGRSKELRTRISQLSY